MSAIVPFELGQLLSASNDSSREAAWEGLIAQHTRLLMAVARSFGGSPDDAMDRYAFILEKLRESDFRRLRAFRDDAGARFSTWLTVAARRLCLDHHRTVFGRSRPTADASRKSLLSQVRRSLVITVGDDRTLENLADETTPSADFSTVASERDMILRDELGKLPPADRLLLALRFEDDLSASRIAPVLGLPNQFSVYRQLNSVLGRLRQVLETRGIDDFGG